MRLIAFVLRAGAVVAGAVVLVAWLSDDSPRLATAGPAPATVAQPSRPAQVKRRAAKKAAPKPKQTVAIVAVGDIVMGSVPNLPPAGGAQFFRDVSTDLAGDVVIGNLEGTLSTGGVSKCKPGSTDCFAFQTPPAYARWLDRAGFTVLNLANNHAFDYGRSGLEQTVRALRAHGLAYTGRPGQITIQRIRGVRVAVVGFAPYSWAQSLTDLRHARALVRKAAKKADLVVVTMHAGGEGVARQHVARGVERYLGENRGNVVAFSHAVVEAGADLVVGHGPHVLRGMEWYKGRLIAYSLGNFGGYRVFTLGGPLSVSGILRVTLREDGRFESGLIVPTTLDRNGVPRLDPAEQAHALVRSLSRADFGSRAAKIGSDGAIRR